MVGSHELLKGKFYFLETVDRVVYFLNFLESLMDFVGYLSG